MYAWLESKLLVMSDTDYQIVLGLFALGFVYLSYFCFQCFRRFRFVHGTATSKIRSAAQGLVELKGLGEWMSGDSITSPLSNSRCVWYHCTVDKRERTGKRTSWTNISDECSEHLFRLVDDTGWCVIDPDHAHVIAESDVTWYGQNADQSRQATVTARLMGLRSGNYRFRERLIRPATSIYALGEFRSIQNSPSNQMISTQADELLKQWKLQPQRYLSQFDEDGNGKIQQQEWKTVRAAARREVLAKVNQHDSQHHVLLCPADKRHPFILSATAEEELMAAKKLRAYGSVVAASLILAAVVLMSSLRPPFPV